MSDQTTLARPYAKAIFQTALAKKLLDEWLQMLQALALIATQPDFLSLLYNPKVTTDQVIELINEVCQSVLPKLITTLAEPLQHFVKLLGQQKRLAVLPGILTVYQQLMAEQERIINVEVASFSKLSKQQKQDLTKALQKRFDSEVTVNYEVKPELMGGLIMKAGDWVVDGTVKSKLARLTEHLRG